MLQLKVMQRPIISMEYNNFTNLKKDDEKIKKELDIIIERNPEQTFYLYLDLRILE